VNYLFMFALLRHQYPAVAHTLTHSVNLAFRSKWGFENICQAGFGLYNEARLQLCFLLRWPERANSAHLHICAWKLRLGVYNLLQIAGRITVVYMKHGRQW